MEEKKADNKISEARKKIDALDEQIIINKKAIESLDDLESSFASINRSINKCAELISKSVKSKKTNMIMNEISGENTIRFSKTVYSFDDEREKLQDDITNMKEEKDQTMKLLKKELEEKDTDKKEEKKEEKNE